MKKSILALALLASSTTFATAAIYEAKIPESVTTPDIVQTKSMGELNFTDGMPTPETVAMVRDDLLMTRGKIAFLDGIPAAAIEAIYTGYVNIGIEPNDVGITENYIDARSLYLTPNTTTIYAIAPVLVKEPVVIEIPAGMLGFLDDANHQYVADLGYVGDDKGEGGKYLIVPDGYEGDIPEGYFVKYTKTATHWFLVRGVATGETTNESIVANMKSGMNIHPLSQPSDEVFMNTSGVQLNAIHANNFDFYEEMNALVQREELNALGKELTGTLKSIGIEKGKEFNPNDHDRSILEEAAQIANATVRALAYAPVDREIFKYEDRQWFAVFGHKNYDFMDEGTLNQNDRSRFHYVASGVTPAMVNNGGEMLGKGSDYVVTARDADGVYLTGDNTYTMNIPADMPTGSFWATMVYSGQTRSGLETDSKKIGIDMLKKDLKYNKDGSITLVYSPEAPNGDTSNWVQTVKCKSFNIKFRNYSPLIGWFDGSWKLGDVQKVK